MTTYELIFIVHPERTDEDARKAVDRVKEVIAREKGEILKVEEWGKRKLAYEIKKQSKGTYFLLHYTGTGAAVNEVERTLRISDDVLKFLTVKLDEKALAAAIAAPGPVSPGGPGRRPAEAEDGGADGEAAPAMAAVEADADGE